MLVQAVAMAIVVCCASSAAMAAGYTEVWNPPESSAHLKPRAVKGQPARHVKGASKAENAAAKRAAHAEGKAKPTSALAKEGKKPHAKIAQTKSEQAKTMHADAMQNHATHTGSIKVIGKKKNTAVNSAAVEPKSSALSANASTGQMEAATNPATARSGSLPPILH